MTPPDPNLELEIRKGSPSVQLTRDEFRERFRAQFVDPAFDKVATEIDAIEAVAWDGYTSARKWPRTRRGGEGFSDPSFELSIEWLAARDAIHAAQALHDHVGPTRILVISSSSRSEHTCPSELSKTFRIAAEACDELRAAKCHVDLLDLSNLASEYGRKIYPCKACASTAMPLCHWPCSCYPNHALGQTQDWMNEIYPLWVAAHGIAIITPVYWYQAPSPLKLMLDRLVCADGGNPDPSSTHGKDAASAKALELAGWSYPRHLAGRVFSVIVHGDTEGADVLRRSLHDTLTDMDLEPAGAHGDLDRYIGYYEPYATSHEALDANPEIMVEVRNTMRVLAERTLQLRNGVRRPGADLADPRPK
ncbi:MAG: putative multimeric flavodoxin [Myxococcales bacterium]|nr:putative multimeric flavodoxin [Myxococcales bacterium]